MVKYVYASIVGLVGAALIHIAIVLLLPQLSENDVWRQIETNSELYDPVRLDRYGVELSASRTIDPMFGVIACRYDLTDGVFSMTAPSSGEFWSVAVFDDLGHIVFSANDRIVAAENLDLVVTLPLQLRVLQESPREAFANAVLVESRRNQGFAVIRIFRPDETYESFVADFVSGIDCQSVDL